MIFDAIDHLPSIVLLILVALEFTPKGTLKERVEKVICEAHIFFVCTINNSPDSFLNELTRLSGLLLPESSYFIKVSSTPDFDNKILSTVESGFEV